MAFEVTVTPRFADTDAAGVAHFARQLEWVEAAEHAWLAQASVPLGRSEHAWPRKALQVTWQRPVAPGVVVNVRLGPFTTGRTSLRYRFAVLSAAVDDSRPFLAGELTIVHVAAGLPAAVEPAWILALGRLAPWLEPAVYASAAADATA